MGQEGLYPRSQRLCSWAIGAARASGDKATAQAVLLFVLCDTVERVSWDDRFATEAVVPCSAVSGEPGLAHTPVRDRDSCRRRSAGVIHELLPVLVGLDCSPGARHAINSPGL
jgi:hypothetical protein